jgi:hypothetical protein
VEESTGNVGVQKELATEAMRESLQGLGGNPYGFKFRCQLPHEDILHAFIRWFWYLLAIDVVGTTFYRVPHFVSLSQNLIHDGIGVLTWSTPNYQSQWLYLLEGGIGKLICDGSF